MADAPPNKPPLLVFSDDWGRHPSSCQHLIRQLLPHRQVLWVNTIGTRPPRLDLSTAKRALGKFRQWFGPKIVKPTEDNELAPQVISPKMWPSFQSAMARRLNKKLMLKALLPAVKALPELPIVVTTLPVVADLIGPLPARRWVYYCVDDFSEWPGYDGATMARMETELLPRVDKVIAVSETLVARVNQLGRSAKLLTHGVDLDHWRKPSPPGLPPEFQGLQPPYVLFWGVIDRRMDTSWVKQLGRKMQEGTIVFIGPQEAPDPELVTLPRVVFRPSTSYARLPDLAANASVLVMPYADIPVNRAIQPLKLKEYLATGKPTVVRELPSTKSWAQSCDVCKTVDGFASVVLERISSGIPPAQRMDRQRLFAEGWDAKAQQFEAWVDGEPPTPEK